MSRDSALGVAGIGFEGGGASVWDEARAAHAHGLGIDEETGEIDLIRTGRLSVRHRANIDRAARIELNVGSLPPETRRITVAAFASVGASHFVANHFDLGVKAPLVGLGLLFWYELRDETRAPNALLDAWDAGLKSGGQTRVATERMLDSVRRRALAVYDESVAVYDEIASYYGRERRAARDREMAALRLRLAPR